MVRDRRWRRRAEVLLWTAMGGTIIGAFFVAAFFSAYSPLFAGDPGAVLLLMPLLTGLLLGILLTDEEIVLAAGAGLLAASLAVTLVAVFLFSPMIAGIAPATRDTAGFSISRTVLSAVLLFPLSVVGSVLGRGVGDLLLPSARVREELERLREETRRWHEALERIEKRPLDGGPMDVPRPPPREEGKD